jgi:hypothetical protein
MLNIQSEQRFSVVHFNSQTSIVQFLLNQNIIFLHSLLICTEPATQNTCVFAFTFVAHGTTDLGYVLQHFQQHFFHDAYFERVIQIYLLCSTEYVYQTQ